MAAVIGNKDVFRDELRSGSTMFTRMAANQFVKLEHDDELLVKEVIVCVTVVWIVMIIGLILISELY
jgi:hypothetical protein